MLLTYNRLTYAEKTLRSTLRLVASREHELAVHIADDGSGPGYIDHLLNVVKDYPFIETVSHSNSQRGGYGRNYNLGTQAIHHRSDFIMPTEDDWELVKPLDLDMLVRALEGKIGIECIRLGYLSFTQALYGRVMSPPPNWEKYLLLDPQSKEPHVFAGHPRLESRAFQQRVGAWPEQLAPGDTEFAVAHKLTARTGVAWPMFFDPQNGPFCHIGTVRSY